jgi:hypothetical protein
MTQDTLARMLGVHRPTISEAAEALRSREIITYRRGRIAITDRDALVEAACEHYEQFRVVYEELLGPAPRTRWQTDRFASRARRTRAKDPRWETSVTPEAGRIRRARCGSRRTRPIPGPRGP